VDPALLLRLLVTPAIVLLAAFVQRRLGPAAGGRLIGLPLTTGPFLVMIGFRSGQQAAATAAAGVVAGQLSVVGFCAVYATLAARVRPRLALPISVAVALVCGALGLAVHDAGVPSWLLATGVVAAIVGALRVIAPPVVDATYVPVRRRWDTPLRMLACTAVVGTLVESSAVLGAGLAGVLVTAPVILSIIVPATHRSDGAIHAIAVARGALAALSASVVAVGLIAETLTRVPSALAIGLAVAALALVELGREAQHGLAARQRDLELRDLVLR
jgi:hypothetical protein